MSFLEREQEQEQEQEQDTRDEMPPPLGHLSDDPAKRIALCGTPILGISARGKPYVRCAVCFDLRYGR